MTDYIKDYQSGKLTVPILNPFAREATNLAVEFTNGEGYYVENGVIRWANNDRVPPKDITDFFAWLYETEGVGEWFDKAATDKARDEDTRAFLAEYRANYQGPSAEEKLEARAAMGAGVEMVNVVTGDKWTT